MLTKDKLRVEKVGDRLYRIDARGLVCPYPQLLVVRALSSLSAGDVLEVLVDNPPSVKDIPPILEERGHKVDVVQLDSVTWRMLVHICK
ncbi:MAG: sulfurtransferase TusA family protein [Candidatus Brockarchaeota archaeon]|nr:sulfurtransferase TusA family protein [Candidatus Brockarchaeota archaeon]MBO3809905.1 sulfurtransferase TusA family protein [Candidatus Brockarchaeota archaeon]